MPLSSLLKSAAGTCPFCRQKASILSREHPECAGPTRPAGRRWYSSPPKPPGSRDFDESHLRLTMSVVAKTSYGNENTVNQALEEGWKLGVDHTMADGIITQDEEAWLREFRDQLALGSDAADSGAMAHLDRASQGPADAGRQARRHRRLRRRHPPGEPRGHPPALKPQPGRPDRRPGPSLGSRGRGSTGRRGSSPWTRRTPSTGTSPTCNLSQSQTDAHGVHTSLVKAAVLREIAEGVVPDRQKISGNVPFNLMKSERLVWMMQDVDYIETVVRRERRGSSHGLSIRIARGVYYRPSAFRSRAIE